MSVLRNTGKKTRSQVKIALPETKSELKEKVLEALGVDALKEEVKEQLKKETSKTDEFFRHPTVLLLLGFALTTILGTFLTSRYQSGEWNRQQAYLTQQRFSEEKRALMIETSNGVTKTLTAIDGILTLFYWNPIPEDLIQQRQKNWELASEEWRNNVNKLKTSLKIHFKNPGIHKRFDEILDERTLLGNETENLLTLYHEKKSRDELKQKAKSLLNQVNKTRELLDELTNFMTQEIVNDRNEQLNMEKR